MKKTQLRIGIIGINGRGTLWRYWHQPQGKSIVAGAADVYPMYLDMFREVCNRDAFVTTDYRELIARPDIDAIAVTTPDYCHEEHAVAALNAGKPVYCEKPMAITIQGCDRMLGQAKSAGRQLLIGFNMRYMDFVRKMKAMVDDGAIGEVKAVWIRHFVGRGSEYYFHDWHALKQNCTSLLLQKGSHDIDVMHYVTGRYTTRVAAFGGLDFFGGDRPNELTCATCEEREDCLESQHERLSAKKPLRHYCPFRREVDIEDNYVSILELHGGIKATYMECHFAPDHHRNYTFIGTEGRIENSQLENKLYYWKRTRERQKAPDEIVDFAKVKDKGDGELGHGGADARITDAFVDMVLKDEPPPIPPVAGRMSVAVGVKAQQSLEAHGQPMDIATPDDAGQQPPS
ncbi:MAG: Gfo/Idh/MocA family oxidoreductase [Kiritimatiellae bacterium]|nr:Gfo/Idh/MocA family oxidoreductase [Kiritimatiellia bacterium]